MAFDFNSVGRDEFFKTDEANRKHFLFVVSNGLNEDVLSKHSLY